MSALQNLTGLLALDVSGNLVEDLSPLSALTKLTNLDLSENQVTDLTPLLELNALETVELEQKDPLLLLDTDQQLVLTQILVTVADNLRTQERLSFTLEENPESQDPELTFLWSGNGILQYSTDMEIWIDVPDAFPPFRLSVEAGTQPFWRVLQAE